MKKRLLSIATIATSLLVLASCQSTDNGDLPETVESIAEETGVETVSPETTETTPISAETDAIDTETAPVVLELTAAEEEEITALFNRMIEYEDHCLEPLMLTADGKVEAYNKVVDERFDTWEEWMAFVESIYMGDKLDRVIEQIEREGHFVNIDGYTYVSAYSGTDFLSKDFTFSVEERSADMLSIKLMRVYFDHFTEPEEKISVYKLQKTDSGWRIAESSFGNAVHEYGPFLVIEELYGGIPRETLLSTPANTFVDEVEIYSNQYPIYINEYGYDMAGPMFEVTDEVHDFMVGRLQEYLRLLYGEDVPPEEITVPEYMTGKDRVEYSRRNTSFLAGPEFISVSFPYDELPGEVPHDITIESLQSMDRVKAAMEYLDIRNPQMQATVSYNLKNEPYEYCYKIFEESHNSAESMVNRSLNYISLLYTVGSDTVLLQINKAEMPEIHSYPALVPLSIVADYIEQRYSDVIVSKDKVEVFYSGKPVAGYYVPCYRFYVDQYSEDKTEKYGYVIDIPMVSPEELEEMMDAVTKAK